MISTTGTLERTLIPNPKDLNITTHEKEKLIKMFNKISRPYDLLNELFSFGLHTGYRRKSIDLLQIHRPEGAGSINSNSVILDIATGTGDFAIAGAKLLPKKIIGIDIASGMLEMARKKIEKRNLSDIIELQEGDGENLPFSDNTFDAATIGFGTKNYEDLEKGLSEISRVLKKGRTVAILEYSIPEKFPVKQLYNFYLQQICPLPGKFVSKNNIAFEHLSESIKNFPQGEDFRKILLSCGFSDVKYFPSTFGIAIVYIATK